LDQSPGDSFLDHFAEGGSMAFESSPPHVGARKADGDCLLPRDFEFDRCPIASWFRTIDAPAPDPFARLKISMLVESIDESVGVRQDCRLPFRAPLNPSKKHC
jgi:hypothetical protein